MKWGLGAPHVGGSGRGHRRRVVLGGQYPRYRVASLTIGSGAVRDPIHAGGALKDIIEAPSLDAVRELHAQTQHRVRGRPRG